MGSPGTRWIRRKTSDTTSQITGRVYNTRRARYRGILKSVLRGLCGGDFLAGPFSASGVWFSTRFSVLSSRFSVSFLGDGVGLQLFDLDPGDAVAIDLKDGVAVAFIFEGLTLTRDSLQAGEDEAGERFESGIARQGELILRFQVANADRAFEHDRDLPFDQGLLGWGDIELIFDFAYDLLQNIFDRDHPGGRSELVYHHSQVPLAFLEFFQQFGEDFGFRDDQHVVHDLADFHGRDPGRNRLIGSGGQPEAGPAHEVFGIEHTHDVLRTALRIIDGHT